jgi:hypothetical protein
MVVYGQRFQVDHYTWSMLVAGHHYWEQLACPIGCWCHHGLTPFGKPGLQKATLWWTATSTNLIFLGPWTETFALNLFILRIILAKCNFQALVGKLGRTGSCFTTRHANMRSCTLAGTGTCSPIKDLVAMSISLDYNMKGDESARILLTVLYKCRSSY